MIDFSKEFEALAEAYEASGGNAASLLDKKSANLVVSHNNILGKNEIPGVHIEGGITPTGVNAKIMVDPGTIVENPVHLCFGVVLKEGIQEIISEFYIGPEKHLSSYLPQDLAIHIDPKVVCSRQSAVPGFGKCC
jgi:uncharacterized protein